MSAYRSIPIYELALTAGVMVGSAMILERAGLPDHADMLRQRAVSLYPEAGAYLPTREDLGDAGPSDEPVPDV